MTSTIDLFSSKNTLPEERALTDAINTGNPEIVKATAGVFLATNTKPEERALTFAVEKGDVQIIKDIASVFLATNTQPETSLKSDKPEIQLIINLCKSSTALNTNPRLKTLSATQIFDLATDIHKENHPLHAQWGEALQTPEKTVSLLEKLHAFHLQFKEKGVKKLPLKIEGDIRHYMGEFLSAKDAASLREAAILPKTAISAAEPVQGQTTGKSR